MQSDGAGTNSPNRPLLDPQQLVFTEENSSAPPIELAVYGRRWWLVTVFSALGILQSATWNFYSPISKDVEAIYGWSDGQVSWLANTAGIVFTVSVSAWSCVIDTQGVRLTTVLSTFFVTICAGLRCVPVATTAHFPLVLVSMVFNGLAAPPIALAPPLISAAWFPVQDRATATAVMTTANYLGQAVGFLFNTLAVPQLAHNPSLQQIEARHDDLKHLYFAEAALGVLIFLATLAYFPGSPPLPPAPSAMQTKTDFLVGMRQLAGQRSFWVLVMAFGIPSGIYSGWAAFLGPNLQHLNIDQDTAAYMGTCSIVAGVVAGVVVGRIADWLGGHLKAMILCMYGGAALAFLWFTLMCSKIVYSSVPLLYVTVILGGFCINGTIPLFYELAVETTFPIAEGSTTGCLVLVQNLIQSMYLGVPVDTLGTAWMNWALAGILPAAILAFIPFEEVYKRRMVDDGFVCPANDEDQTVHHDVMYAVPKDDT